LGGWSNAQSAVRNGAQGDIWYSNSDQITPGWGTYRVTVLHGTSLIITYGSTSWTWTPTDPTQQALLASVQYFSFTTWDTNVTYQNIIVYPTIVEVHGDEENYSPGFYPTWELPTAGDGVLQFDAQVDPTTPHDLIVGLFPAPTLEGNNFLEIVLGGWSNTQSAVRNGAQGDIWYTNSDQITTDPTTYYITVSQGASLTVSYGTTSWTWAPTDPTQLALLASVQYFSFSSWDANVVYKNFVVSPSAVTVTNDLESYSVGFYPAWAIPNPGDGTFQFDAQADPTSPHDVIFGLFPLQSTAGNNFLDVPLGGWSNTQSAVRNGAQGDIWYSNTYPITTGWVTYQVSVTSTSLTVSYGNTSWTWAPTDPTQLALLASVQYFSFSTWDTSIDYQNIVVN